LGEADLPFLGEISISGRVNDHGRYQLTGSAEAGSINQIPFPVVGVTLSNEGLFFRGESTLPLIKSSVLLEGAVRSVNDYFLQGEISAQRINGFYFPNIAVSLSAGAGLIFSGKAKLKPRLVPENVLYREGGSRRRWRVS
jgi:hypothetical protein